MCNKFLIPFTKQDKCSMFTLDNSKKLRSLQIFNIHLPSSTWTQFFACSIIQCAVENLDLPSYELNFQHHFFICVLRWFSGLLKNIDRLYQGDLLPWILNANMFQNNTVPINSIKFSKAPSYWYVPLPSWCDTVRHSMIKLSGRQQNTSLW